MAECSRGGVIAHPASGFFEPVKFNLTKPDDALRRGVEISYTQWEAWLALYHGKLLLTAKAEPLAPRGPRFAPTDQSREAQRAHLGRLEMVRRYPDCSFESAADLARHIAYTASLESAVPRLFWVVAQSSGTC
jgi:hypothetical protein